MILIFAVILVTGGYKDGGLSSMEALYANGTSWKQCILPDLPETRYQHSLIGGSGLWCAGAGARASGIVRDWHIILLGGYHMVGFVKTISCRIEPCILSGFPPKETPKLLLSWGAGEMRRPPSGYSISVGVLPSTTSLSNMT